MKISQRTMMTAADLDESVNNGTTPSLLLLLALAVPICIILGRLIARKQAEPSSTMRESPQERRERMTALREKRLNKLVHEEHHDEEEKHVETTIPSSNNTNQGLRQRTPSKAATVSDTIRASKSKTAPIAKEAQQTNQNQPKKVPKAIMRILEEDSEVQDPVPAATKSSPPQPLEKIASRDNGTACAESSNKNNVSSAAATASNSRDVTLQPLEKIASESDSTVPESKSNDANSAATATVTTTATTNSLDNAAAKHEKQSSPQPPEKDMSKSDNDAAVKQEKKPSPQPPEKIASKSDNSVSISKSNDTSSTPTVDTITTRNSRDGSAVEQTKKKSKRRRLLPPPQLLCEALTQIFRCRVMVESNPEAGTWGGNGWIKRTCDYPSTISITLTLHVYKPESMESEWEALTTVFSKLLNKKLRKQMFHSPDVRQAAIYHSRAKNMARNGFALVVAGDEGFEELKTCVETLSLWLAEQVSTWIRTQVEAVQKDDEAAFEEVGDLFTSDYGGEATPKASAPGTEPMDVLFLLLQDAANPVVTASFLEDLFTVYNRVARGDEQLPRTFMSHALKELALTKQSRPFSSTTLAHRVAALTSLFSAPSVCQALASAMQDEVAQMKDKNGKEIQALVRLAPLFEAAAYVVPPAGAERSREGPFLNELERIEAFPLCAFRAQGTDEVGASMTNAMRTMKAARNTAELSLRIAFKYGGKAQTFQWLTNIIRSNEPLLRLLKSDLLETDGLVAESSTRDFLLGLASTLVSFCHSSLTSLLEAKGADAFDVAYLRKALDETCQEPVNEQNRLFQGSTKGDEELVSISQTDFPGATHFFFLSCLLLRVALHPALRMQEDFHSRYYMLLDAVQGAERADENPPAGAFKSHSPFVSVWLGWKAFLSNPDFVSCVTEISLIQLGWLTAMARERGRQGLAMIPDFTCREPARWLSYVATTSPRSLKPHQAEKAIEFVASLLALATDEANSFGFSPLVITSLIQVPSSFVRAGVNRARNKERRRGGISPSEADDEHNLDVYLSFDRNDLGVTVFTHQVVKDKLCPTLLRTFVCVDAAEGVDADRDAAFSKLSAKADIAELLLRLWCHPSSECRESVTLLSACEILSFVSSLSVATRMNLDFGTEAVEKTSMNRGNERAVLQAAGHLCGMRKYLALLCALSGDDRIAACLGGNAVASSDCKLFVTNLSNMIIQFLEKLTSSDGGTNPSLKDGDMEPTSSVLANMKDLAPEEKKRLAEDVVRRRIRAKTDFGLDISVVCHQLLALAARWHLAVATNAEAARSSPFLSIMASNDDCDVERLTNVFRRLVSIPEHFEGSELDNVISIFMHDGHVDHSAWAHKYEANKSSEEQKRNRRTARQFQTKHEEIAQVASNVEIMSFIDDLSREVSRLRDGQRKAFSPSEIATAERSIFARSADLSEEKYSRHLSSEWIVSSSPFTSSIDEDRFLHSYDKTARNRGIQAPVRLLVKEARNCRRTMPSPSANSAIYVCFAEERMDLCRVVMSGPVETPYAHGLYEFDVYFPPTYPQVPPLVTFMTTGGGRVNPNLYVDGKVCISLLHNTTTSDESQRWNPKSSLAQLMISIQSQILGVKEPYFNEGNGVPERMRLTPAGRSSSAKYNNTVRLETLRCAMVEQLRSPPRGFEEVTVRHFSMCRQRIVVQARRWMFEARHTDKFARYERTYAELLSLLDTDAMNQYDCIAPLPEDLAALETLEPSFFRLVRSNNSGIQGGSMALVGDHQYDLNLSDSASEQVNPWAPGAYISSTRRSSGNEGDPDDPDDELYD